MRILLGLLALSMASAAFTQDDTRLKHETDQVNGIKMHYVTCGEGQTILFLHGFPEFWYAWKSQLAHFGEKRFQAVACDMRGYNLTEKPAKLENYAIPVLVEDIRALLDKVSKGKKSILVAHDWGGAIAWVVAAMHPELIEKLVIINAPHPTIFGRELAENPKQQQASGYMNFFKSPGAEAILSANNYAALVSAILDARQGPKATEEERKAYIAAWSQPGALTGGLNYYRASNVGPPDPAQKAAPTGFGAMKPVNVSVPTLVIWGEKDTALLTGNLDGLDKYVPRLTIRRIPKGTHWVIHEEGALISKMIESFVKGETVPEAR